MDRTPQMQPTRLWRWVSVAILIKSVWASSGFGQRRRAPKLIVSCLERKDTEMPALDYEQVAHLYDVYVQSNFDIDFFLAEATKVSGKVLELMCGTGRLSLPLIEAGVDLSCVDSSPAMLHILRQKLADRKLSASVIEMDVCHLSLGKKYDLIFIPFHSFAEIKAVSDQRQALRKIYAHLTDNGRFICTLHNPPVRLQTADGRQKLVGKFRRKDTGGNLFVWSLENYAAETELVTGYQFYEEYDARGAMLSKLFVDIQFRSISKTAFMGLVETAGFEIERLYGDYSKSEYQESISPVMVWYLRKSKS